MLRGEQRWERSHIAALAAITCVAAVLRLRFLSGDMRYDEAQWYVSLGRGPLGEILHTYVDPGNHVLHTVLQHFATRAFGDAPEILRLPALLSGVALIPAIYLAGRALYDSAVGLVAAALAAPAGALVLFSVNARGYTLLLVLTMLIVPVGLHALESEQPAAWLVFALLAALGLWTVPTMVYGLGVVAMWLLFVALEGDARARRTALLGLGGGLAATALIAALLYWPLLGEPGWHIHTDWPLSLRSILDGFSAGFGALRWVLAAAIAAAVVLHRRISPRRAPLWLALALMVPAGALLSPQPPPFLRSWLGILPFLLILAGAGLVAAARTLGAERLLPVAAVGVAAALSVGLRATDLPESDDPPAVHTREVASWLAAHSGPRDAIVVNRFAAPPLIYELARRDVATQPSGGDGHVVVVAGNNPRARTWVVAVDARGGLTRAQAAHAIPGAATAPLALEVPGARIYRVPAS